jgi:hypothetical protein
VSAAVILTMAIGGGAYAFFVLLSAPDRFLAGLPWLVVTVVTLLAAGIFLHRVGPTQRGNQKVFDEAALERQYRFILLGFLFLFLSADSIVTITLPLAALVALGMVVAWIAIWLPEGARTRVSGFEFAVTCSPEKAFDFVADRRNEPLYEKEVEVSELLTELPIGVGSRFFQRVRLPDILMEAEEFITEFERPQRLGLEMTTRQNSGGTFTFSTQLNETLIRWDFYQVHGLYQGWAGLLLHPAQHRAAERIARHRQAWSTRLKEILES